MRLASNRVQKRHSNVKIVLAAVDVSLGSTRLTWSASQPAQQAATEQLVDVALAGAEAKTISYLETGRGTERRKSAQKEEELNRFSLAADLRAHRPFVQ
jgi:hypothetical protein